MQTTLLGLGIAIILALLAALIGPYFVNWNDHRAFFEAEASRLTGLDVRVGGPIKVGVLPVPSVTLGGIEIRPAGDASRLRARSLAIELGLGPLMRGEIRALEIRLVGPEFSLGLNGVGQIDWPAVAVPGEALAIDRLSIEDGRAVLTDVASRSRLTLDKLWFRGELRSLSGPFRGEGAFVTSGSSYNYRVSAGRNGPDGNRVRVDLDAAGQPFTFEAEGMLAFDRAQPKFDGAFTLSRSAGSVKADGETVFNEPWRLAGKVRADSRLALFEQIAFQYGPDERSAKLGGAAEFRFGERPRLQGALSARQLDIDRLLATPETPRRRPMAALQGFADLVGRAARPTFPVSLAVSVDTVTLGGATVQNVGGDIRSEDGGWQLQKLELRAPGFTQLNLSGRLASEVQGIGFTGAASIESNDPKALLAWLAGEPAPTAQIKPWQARGEITLAADRIAVERLRSEFDRGTVEGRLSYWWPTPERPSRLDADLKAGELDLDGLLAFGDSALAGLGLQWPREIALALEVGRARIAGFEARNTAARVSFDAHGISVERLSVADFGSASVQAKGRIETAPTAGGHIAVELDARELDSVLALADKFAPPAAEALRRLAGAKRSAKLGFDVSLANAEAGMIDARLGLKGRVGALRINLTAGATGRQDVFAEGHLGGLAATELRLDAQLQADDSATLFGLAGLDRFAVADRRPAMLSVSVSGPLKQDLKFGGKLAAGGIDIVGEGALRLSTDRPGLINFERLIGSLYGHKLQGRLAVKLAEATQIDGDIETETLDVPATVAAAIGMRRRSGQNPQAATWSSEPFVLNATGLTGRIAFKAERASLSPTLDVRQLRGTARLGPSDVVFEDVDGELAKGRLAGRLAFGSNAEGLIARAKVDISGAEMAAVYPRAGRPPISGRLTFKAEVEGAGLSPAAFIGSLAGSGTIGLDDAQFADLNPRVFDAVIRAVDLGIPADSNRIRNFVATSLDGAGLPVTRANATVRIAAGQLRLADVVTEADGVDVVLAAALDLTSASLDANLTMSGRQTIGGTDRPTVLIALKGALPTPQRTIDANLLASWLALRSVDQQARQLEQLERAQREAQERAEREASERRQRELPEAPQSIPVAPMDDVGMAPATASVPNASINPGGASPLSTTATSGISASRDVPPLPPPVDIGTPPRPRAVPHVDDSAAPAQARPPAIRHQAPKPTTRRPGQPLDLLGGSYR